MKVSIVGAGHGGLKLTRLFNEMNEVEVLTVVDRNKEAPGALYARQNGINFVTDLGDIDERTEMIIEATGNEHVLKSLTEKHGGKKRIVESDVAAMMMRVVDKQTETATRLNHQLKEISNVSNALHTEMDKILEVTQELNTINDQLVLASNESKRYIEQTDEMIRAVNKITQQIKILGLNANIEAARAGEHGRGFSVVATEVQKMSDNTSNFAGQISDLLSALGTENTKMADEVSKLDRISEIQKNITHVTKQKVDILKEL